MVNLCKIIVYLNVYFVELDKSYNEEQQQQQQRESPIEKSSISNHNQASKHDAADSSTKQNQRECDGSHNALKPKLNQNHQAHKHKEQNVYKKFNNSNNVSNKVQFEKKLF